MPGLRIQLCRHLAAACALALAGLAPDLIWAAPNTHARVPARPAVHAAAVHAAALAPHSTGLNYPRKRSTVSAVTGPRNVLRANPAAKTAPRFVPGRATTPPVVGGPARYNATKGAAIGGTLMRRKP